MRVQVRCFLLVSEGDNRDSQQEQRGFCFSEISADGFFDYKSEVSREVHAPFWERLEVQFFRLT